MERSMLDDKRFDSEVGYAARYIPTYLRGRIDCMVHSLTFSSGSFSSLRCRARRYVTCRAVSAYALSGCRDAWPPLLACLKLIHS
jgi:hypothetical protein